VEGGLLEEVNSLWRGRTGGVCVSAESVRLKSLVSIQLIVKAKNQVSVRKHPDITLNTGLRFSGKEKNRERLSSGGCGFCNPAGILSVSRGKKTASNSLERGNKTRLAGCSRQRWGQ